MTGHPSSDERYAAHAEHGRKVCGRSYRSGSGRYYECSRAAGHTGGHLPWPDPVVPSEPPAETQQDDGGWGWIKTEEGSYVSGPAETRHEFCCGEGEQFIQQAEEVLFGLVQTDCDAAADAAAATLTALLPAVLAYGDARALAARPSADTETLLAGILRKLMAGDSFLALSTHRSESGMPVQFTLDDTTVGLTDAEADAIKAEAGW